MHGISIGSVSPPRTATGTPRRRWRGGEAWARDSNAALERAGIEDRVDHRTLVAQRDEALELAAAARERGDEGAELRETVQAVELNCPPLPQLSSGA
ncbi:hypothetical protein [Pukyongiella litopenaei]|uniref:Uncharacterized protein n=1 Tax=Pukyongiella litopenaei TaxID=2605946 RepID=A0A2S0MQ00_9RHOB|nr:hypothetical protein [Pukyongiella litopenaei]AVO37944.2 hypothetical protein C6Y53_09665 [Pukyongiella litopenaei]